MRTTFSLARDTLVALLTLGGATGAAVAQDAPLRRFELRSFGGAFVPTGSQHSSLTNGATLGLQGAYSFNRYFAAVGTVAWSAAEENSLRLSDVDVYQYDLGAEAGFDKPMTSAVTLRPFIGVGLGGRAYDYTDRNTEAQYNLAGYGGGGAQLSMGRFGWRFEVRDYVSGFKGLNGELESSETRNDLTISSAFTVRF